MPSFEKFLATIRDTTRRSLSTEKSGSLLRNGSRSELPLSALIESVTDHPFHSARKPDQGVSGGKWQATGFVSSLDPRVDRRQLGARRRLPSPFVSGNEQLRPFGCGAERSQWKRTRLCRAPADV